MDTILYLTDTHAGASVGGFMQQPRRVDLLPHLYSAVGAIAHTQGTNLVIHGGDLTENGAPSQIRSALLSLIEVGIPVAACVGNHDLAKQNSLKNWIAAAAGTSVLLADRVVSLTSIDVILLNNAWSSQTADDFFWDAQSCKECLMEAQWAWLERALVASRRPAIVVVHAPLDALPPRLTGEPADLHVPQAAYASRMRALLDLHPRVKLVLSGHNHVTFANTARSRVQMSTSSLVEPPFQVRLIRVKERTLAVETLPAIEMPPDGVFHERKAWTSGANVDRSVNIRWEA